MGKDREFFSKQGPSDSSLIKLCEVGQRPSLRNLLHKVSQQATKEQKHLLLKAIEHRHEELVTLLLENGADPNVKDAVGDTPLHVALKTGQNEIAATILRYNADVNVYSRKGLTPLHYAAHQRDHALVKKLLLKGADVNLENSEGRTPLMVVCKTGCVPLARILLQNGSDISKTDRLGWKASDYAIIGGIYGELKALIPDQVPEINENDFCRTCNKREPLSPSESIDSLFNREPGNSNFSSDLETYATTYHPSSLDRQHSRTPIKLLERPVPILTNTADNTKEIMEKKNVDKTIPATKECGHPLTVDCSCPPKISTEPKYTQSYTNVEPKVLGGPHQGQRSPTGRQRNASFPSLQILNIEQRSPTNSNTNLSFEDESPVAPTSRNLSKGPQKLDRVLPDLPSTYGASSKISFTTDRLDAIEKLVGDEKAAKIKARAYVRGLEEANENLFNVKNDLEQALHAAQNTLKDRDHRLDESQHHLHDLEDRLADELHQKERDLGELQASRQDARLKDNACQSLKKENDNLAKKCKELEKKLDDEKGSGQKLKNDVDTMNGDLDKAKDDVNAKNKLLHGTITELNKLNKPDAQQSPPPSSATCPSVTCAYTSPVENQIANAVKDTKDNIENLKKRLGEQGKENEKLRNDNKNLKGIIDDTKVDQAKKAEGLQQKLDDAKNNNRRLEDQVGALKKQVQEAEVTAEKVKPLMASVSSLTAERENALQDHKNEQKNVKALEKRIKDLEAENSRLRCEVARLRDCLRVTRRQQEKAETKVHELHNELQIGRATLDQCRLTPSCSRSASADFSNPTQE